MSPGDGVAFALPPVYLAFQAHVQPVQAGPHGRLKAAFAACSPRAARGGRAPSARWKTFTLFPCSCPPFRFSPWIMQETQQPTRRETVTTQEKLPIDYSAYDIAVLGAGIIGLATALALARAHPSLRIGVLEKESAVARHQSGHNSGVIHAGIYYQPGSLKAVLCIDGARRMVQYCEDRAIPYQRCGKVIVATGDHQVPALHELLRRGNANGVPGLRLISPEELRELEPHAVGIAALHSSATGILDYAAVARSMAADLAALGVEIGFNHQVKRIHRQGEALLLTTRDAEIGASYLVNCAGLQADILAGMAGANPDLRIVPFRGEYYFLRPDRQSLVLRHLIYPVPDPELPFLGVHFTPTIHGEVEVGPNAVLALAREGYSHCTIQPRDVWTMVTYPGFPRLARRLWRTGLDEFSRSFSKDRFARSLQRLVPDVTPDDLIPGGAGVRAQAVARDGTLVDDFAIARSPRAIHVLNAPSPAATASLAIGEYIAKLTGEELRASASAAR